MSSQRYTPINCSTYDELTLFAMRKWQCRIKVKDNEGSVNTVSGTIADVYSRGKEEFLRLDDGTEVRLDRVVDVSVVEQ